MCMFNSKAYWDAIKRGSATVTKPNMSAKFIFGKIPRTVSVNWMLPK